MIGVKKYLVVTDAIREGLDPYNNGEKGSYKYRKGELGLIHPVASDYFFENEDFLGWSHRIRNPVLYKPHPEDIPALVYLPKGSGHLIMTLRQGEFSPIDGVDFATIIAETKRIYQEIGFKLGFIRSDETKEKTLEEEIKKRLISLESFETIPGPTGRRALELEVTYHELSGKDLADERREWKESNKIKRRRVTRSSGIRYSG